jgi:hypothetical protein
MNPIAIVTDVVDEGKKKRIESIRLSKCLTERSLTFGDEEQIKALKKLQEEADQIQALKKYEVEFDFSGSYTIEVEAENEEEAEEIANEEFNIHDADDFNVDYTRVRELDAIV